MEAVQDLGRHILKLGQIPKGDHEGHEEGEAEAFFPAFLWLPLLSSPRQAQQAFDFLGFRFHPLIRRHCQKKIHRPLLHHAFDFQIRVPLAPCRFPPAASSSISRRFRRCISDAAPFTGDLHCSTPALRRKASSVTPKGLLLSTNIELIFDCRSCRISNAPSAHMSFTNCETFWRPVHGREFCRSRRRLFDMFHTRETSSLYIFSNDAFRDIVSPPSSPPARCWLLSPCLWLHS